MTSQWPRWRLKSPASRLFTPFIQSQIKEKIKAPRHWPLCGEFTGGRWIPRTKGQWRGKCFHFMTSSWVVVIWRTYNLQGILHWDLQCLFCYFLQSKYIEYILRTRVHELIYIYMNIYTYIYTYAYNTYKSVSYECPVRMHFILSHAMFANLSFIAWYHTIIWNWWP